MIKGLKFVRVPASDQARAVAFWTRNFGFTVARQQPFDESRRWVELRIPGGDTRLVLYQPAGSDAPAGSVVNMAFTADDVDRTYAALRSKGVEFVGPVQKADWGSSAVFKDSEGNSFLIVSP